MNYTLTGMVDVGMELKRKSELAETVRTRRKELGMTQEDMAKKAGVGLRFVRDLEQGKRSLRMDKVDQVLWLFGLEAGTVDAPRD